MDSPFGETVENRFERNAEFGQRIFDARGNFGEDFAVDEFLAFKFAELLGQHFFGDAAECAAQFAKAHRRLIVEFPQNASFPFSRKYLDSRFDRTKMQFFSFFDFFDTFHLGSIDGFEINCQKSGKNRNKKFKESNKMSFKNSNAVNPQKPKRVAIVIANPAVSSTTGWKVGFWWSELTHPFYALTEKGYEVEVFSPNGGRCEADAMSDPRDASGYSSTDLISLGFIHTPTLAALIEDTKKTVEIDTKNFDAIIVAGGQAPMFNFEQATDLHKKFVEFYESGKIAAALCHGTAILRYTKLSNGEYLAKGKTITGFANTEEDFADNAVWDYGMLERDKHIMPWRIEDELKNTVGANYIQAGLWRGFAVRDGNLITGQQNFSGAETAQVVIEALGG